MTFLDFCDFVREHILDGWMEEGIAEIEAVQKNNNQTYTTLILRKEDCIVTPIIYLEDFYEMYKRGGEPEQVLKEIRKSFEFYNHLLKNERLDLNIMEFDPEKIICRVVNYQKNQEMLAGCPYVRLEDLAITFRWVAYDGPNKLASALITNEQIKIWGVTAEELMAHACENTQKSFPSKIFAMGELLKEVHLDEMLPEIMDSPLYILTNSRKANGATAMIYEGVLGEFAEKKGCDLFILPSSIHEVILLPTRDDTNVSVLYDIVEEANSALVSPEEILSESIYYYSRKDDKITLVEKPVLSSC